MKKIIKGLLIALAVIIVIVGGYFAYFFLSWSRLPDNIVLDVSGAGKEHSVPVGKELTINTYNVGFGAYSPDYGFFMDGGTESWGWSKEEVTKNILGAKDIIVREAPDFAIFQEVDINGTRSYHINQYEILRDNLKEQLPVSTYAISFNCPFIMYPILQPHGKNLSCMETLAAYDINSAYRRSLPIDEGLSRVLDLDRCFSVSEFDTENGKKLYLYNLHLSAYSEEADTVSKQLEVLYEDIKKNYEGGNYIVVGGDFNQDMPGNSAELFSVKNLEASWTKAFNRELLPYFMRVADPSQGNWNHASCRIADGPYVEGETFVITVDGFLVSDNIDISEVTYLDYGYAYSDHDPVRMVFTLK